ncbi:hypothetical protein [Sinorhizobium meliloti]
MTMNDWRAELRLELEKLVDCKFRGNPPPDSEMISPPNSEK